MQKNVILINWIKGSFCNQSYDKLYCDGVIGNILFDVDNCYIYLITNCIKMPTNNENLKKRF